MKVWIPRLGERALNQRAFIAKGGEGSVYAWDDTAVKIYADPKRVIPEGKLQELACISHPSIIKPESWVVDAKGRPVGYSMRFVQDTSPLCRFFTRSYKRRHGVSPEMAFGWVMQMMEGVQHLHDRGIWVVDLNEMNFLLSPGKDTVHFIDVDSYQTQRFPATAISESIRDRHAPDGVFGEGTDWFSFAVVTFQLMVGIHPYRGKHPDVKGWGPRMEANLSVFDPSVRVPSSCESVEVIPQPFRDWYRAVLDDGFREPPPQANLPIWSRGERRPPQVASARLEMISQATLDGPLLFHAYRLGRRVLVTGSTVEVDGTWLPLPEGKPTAVAFTPRHNRPIVMLERNGETVFFDAIRRVEWTHPIAIDALTSVNGQCVLISGRHILGLRFHDGADSCLVTTELLGTCVERAREMYPGVVMQSLLGRNHASILTDMGRVHVCPLPELDGATCVDAHAEGRVLLVLVAKDGHYDRYRFRFDASFRQYDVLHEPDVQVHSLACTVLDTGVGLLIDHQDALVVFAAGYGQAGMKRFSDCGLAADGALVKEGSHAYYATEQEFFRLKLQAA